MTFSSINPAHPHATGVAVYPALLPFFDILDVPVLHIGQKMPIFQKYFISYETDLARLLKQENAFNVLLSRGNLRKEDLMHFMRQKYGYYLWFMYAS